MLIRVADFYPNLSIKISGDEPWLKEIEKNLQVGEAPPASKITGEIHLRKDSAGFVYGDGSVKHTPTLSCSRCAIDILWPLEAKIAVTWRPPFESVTPRELALTSEDLDVYFIEDGKIDISQIVNDVLLCAIPDQIVPRMEGSDDCGVCGINLLNNLVYGNNEPLEITSPFDVLKNLKK